MLKVLRQRNFGFLLLGQSVSLVGDWFLFIALPFYIYDVTGSVLATSAMFIVEVLPRVVVGSIAGVFIDRWDRKKTMIGADLLRALTLAPILFVHSAEQLWIIYVAAFLTSMISQFFGPAKMAIIPILVSGEDLMPANALNNMTDPLSRLIGPALGGMMMALYGMTSVIAADMATFLFSALMLALMVVPKTTIEHAHTTARQAGSQWVHVWSEWAAGLRLLKNDRLLLALFVVFGVMTLGDSMISALVVPFAKQVMRGDAMTLGWVMTAQAAGALIGGLVIGRLGRNWAPTRLIAVSLLVIGLLTVIVFNLPYFPVAVSMLFLIGLFVPAAFITGETLLQSNTRDEYRGRIFGTLGTTLALASLIGMAFAGLWGDSLGTVNILNLASAVYISSGLIALVMLRQPSPKPAPGIVAAE
jgi:MFS family permease